MPTTLDRMHQIGEIINKSFYPKQSAIKDSYRIRGLFAEVGIEIKKEGKTSVNLVRELRETK